MAFIIIIGIFVLVGGLLIANYFRKRGMAFEGVVTDKDIREHQVNNSVPGQGGISINNNGGVQHDYVIKVDTGSGKTITWKISQGKYEMVKIGDRVSKQKGTTDIEITPQAPTAVPTTTPPPAAPPTSTLTS